MIKVWGRTNSINVQKVMWAIGEADLAHERVDAGGKFGRLDTPEYGEFNPNRRIPVLQDGENVVWESHSCVRYLAACYSPGKLWAQDAGRRSLADRWMDWKSTTLQPQLHVLFWGLIRTPEDRRDLAAIAAAEVEIQPIWSLLDAHLAEHDFVAGAQLTMGDIPLGCAWWRYSHLPIRQPDYPFIARWFARLQDRSAYREHVMIDVT